ncbi:phage tail tape measure protein [Phototrophicus methaneseepsis]|uniref:Phage tail tape measure protein n=1 Tax=Phototrophicus methaneseepsis TaxID=2710758 RepID=A0A7S8IDR0_9CHLR|nr:phage tail tape measure protein [Phototrophicus methaneseepsis]QPC81073.1 phage tail tape measure protein [Phototrophicus methaneseepsis]
MTTVTDLQVLIRGDASGVQNAIRSADSQVSGFSGRTRNRLSQVYSAFQMVGLGVLGVGAASVGVAIEFESSFADVRKTVNGSDEELANLQERIREMATDDSNPLSAIENSQNALAGIAAMGGQLGIGLGEMESFIQTVGNLDVATNLSADTIGEVLARYANIADLDASEFASFGDSLVTLGNNMAAQETDIAATLSYIQQLATMGFDSSEILAYSAALPSLGITPEAGGSALVQTVTTLTSLLADAGDRQDLVSALDIDDSQLDLDDIEQSLRNVLSAYNDLSSVEKIDFLDQFGLDGIRQQRLINSLSAGMGTLDNALVLSADGWQGNGAAMTEAAAKAGTTQGNINEMINSLRELGIMIGETLLPGLNDAIDTFTEFLSMAKEGDLGGGIEMLLTDGAQALADFLSIPVDVAEGLAAIGPALENAATIFQIVLGRIQRDVDIWALDLRKRFAELMVGLANPLVDARVLDQSVVDSLQAEADSAQTAMMNIDFNKAMEQRFRGMAFTGDVDLGFDFRGFDFGELIMRDENLGAQLANQFDSLTESAVMAALKSAFAEGDAISAEGLMQITQFTDPEQTRSVLQQEIRDAIESGDAEAFQAIASMDITQFLLGEDTISMFESELQMTLESEQYGVTTDLMLFPGIIDVSRVAAAVAGAVGSLGGGLGNGLQGPVPPPGYSGGGNTINVNSYGQSPYALAEQLRSAQRSLGH